jgi:uncharacterized protein (TIGR03083 family)
MDHEEYCARVLAEITRMASVAESAVPASPVPGCPGWDLAKLVKHTGITHRWAAAIVATRATERIASNALDVALPADRTQYPHWLAVGAAPLVTVLRDAGPETPMWTWAGDGDSGWWARRMLHETTVHRADAEMALGIEPSIDPVAAADGIDEFLVNMADRAGHWPAGPHAGQSIHLHATDEGLGEAGEWLIRLGGDGDGASYTWSHGHGQGDLAVRGPAARLLLLIYGRISAADERLTLFGDDSLIASWQEVVRLV